MNSESPVPGPKSLVHDDGQVTLYQGDVRAVLRGLPAESVHCVVTSPPYWSLRDYGIEPSVWGGDEHHIHDWEPETRQAERYTGKTKWQHIGEEAAASGVKVRDVDPNAWGHPQKSDTAACSCGAWRGALGLEPTPELFIAHMVDVFREVRRVLRADGTLWLNIGDSYASGGGMHVQGERGLFGGRGDESQGALVLAADVGFRGRRAAAAAGVIKAKDLVGIPWMLAFALRADGWWLRQDIIWAKPNPMPESVTDRCTKAHEYVFLLSKSDRYWYDADAVREGAAYPEGPGNVKPVVALPGEREGENYNIRGSLHLIGARDSRNKRSVWQVATAPFPEAHFATYPPDLVRPCILAGCPEGGTVLDPFIGSGTTAMVARQLGRRAIGIDLNPEYLAMAARRVGQPALMMPAAPSNETMAAAVEQMPLFEEGLPL